MGKGKRVRAERAGEKQVLREQAAKKAKKDKVTKILVSAVAIVLAVALIGGLVYNFVNTSLYNKGVIQRGTVVLETENYSVDAAMMSYFFYSQYNNFANTYSSYLSSLGLDTSKSLKSQDSTFSSGSSWFEYFADQAGTEVKELLYLAEKAIADDLKLDEEDDKTIQSIIDQYYAMAKENKLDEADFISAVFGRGVNENDVRKCLELSTLAQKYMDKYRESLVYSDADIEKYYNDNVDTYRYVDYYSYTVVASDTADEKTYVAAKKKAQELADVDDTDEFAEWVEKDFRDSTDITDKYTKEDLEEDLETELKSLESTQVKYVKDDDASEWLFKKAKVGDTFIDDDEKGGYTVFYCTATPYRDETATRSIRNIVLTTDTYSEKEIEQKAKDLAEEMKKAGLTEETFEKYALEYSEQTTTSGNGGLCEDFKESSYEGNIGAWTFDKNRKEGDFEVVKIDGGYAICYYVGEGVEAWKADCKLDKMEADYNASYETWKKEITLTENEKGYDVIPDVV